jgi:hypothetical protein
MGKNIIMPFHKNSKNKISIFAAVLSGQGGSNV